MQSGDGNYANQGWGGKYAENHDPAPLMPDRLDQEGGIRVHGPCRRRNKRMESGVFSSGCGGKVTLRLVLK